MSTLRFYPRTKNILLALQLLGDLIFSFVGLSLGYWVRFNTSLSGIGVENERVTYISYLPLLGWGTFLFLLAFLHLKIYDSRLLLRQHRAVSIIVRAVGFWFVMFLGLSLVLKFDPPVSRLFVAVSCLTTLVVLAVWRFSFYAWLSQSIWRKRLIQRIVVVGWNREAAELAEAITRDANHPYEIVGIMETPTSSILPVSQQVGVHRILGNITEMEAVINNQKIGIVVMADLDLAKEQVMQVAALCERYYVTFKIIPSFFQIFVSNLRLETVSGVPILGVEELPIRSVANQLVKRLIDVTGAFVGLAISLPIVAVLALLIKRQSPGSVFYKQVRTGLDGRSFDMYKLRSMRFDAEVGTGARWAVKNDLRRTRIGTFMRETNLDELPQFWNVLKGDMSLVGPRPERPELIERFEKEIPHYNPRHEVRPGITGWAQVNGLRGDTSLVDRIKYDLYYIENWSVSFDFQIMLMTFVRRENAY